jgi:hypothetical protein
VKTNLTDLERLDLAAKAQVTEDSLGRLCLVMAIISVFLALLAFASEAALAETVAVCVIAALAAVATFSLWLRWRFSVQAFAIFVCAIGVGSFFFGASAHSLAGWVSRFCYLAFFLLAGCRWWISAIPFATVSAAGWEKENSQVRQWLELLRTESRPPQVWELASGSFGTGYYTHRLLKTDNFWAAAKFKRGKLRRLCGYRIYDAQAVRIVESANDKLTVQIGDKLLRADGATPDMAPTFPR